MPHEIDTTNGSAAMLTGTAPPWQSVGCDVREALTSQEAIRLAGLDWQVDQWPVCATAPDGETVKAEHLVANVRTDTRSVLGVVTRK